jgi:two-component system cell cycle response regulator
MDEKGITQILEAPVAIETEPGRDGETPLYLIVLAGGIPGAMLPLVAGGNWIGRAEDSSLRLADPSISRRHAVLTTSSRGQAVLTDLGSTNGTLLNGRRLKPHVPCTLNDGDRIRIGTSIVLKFVRPDPDEEKFQREMFERTVRDALTGLYNRAYFLHQLGPLSRRSADQGLGLAVLLLDVDHFKRINDTHGHAAGDAVLGEVAAVLRQATRPDDLVARYGGEEFVVALPVATPALALARAERIRQALAARPMRVGGRTIRVTASIGVAVSPADRPKAPSMLISTADLHLYRAKETGRNRVVGALPGELQAASQVTSDGELDPILDVPPARSGCAITCFEGL